jgi:acetylornithine deacetylase/succinyl-diaminopimelate desuccinylase-like protein
MGSARLMSLEPQRTVSELQELQSLTSDANGAHRAAWTDTWLKARDWFQSQLKVFPWKHHYDAAGNSWTILEGASEKALLLGGHLDSVPDGGWLDRSLGVVASLEVLRGFAKEFGGRPPVTVRWLIGPTKRVPALAGVFWDLRHSPAPRQSKPTGAAPTKTAYVWEMR